MVLTSCAGWRKLLQELNVTRGRRGPVSLCQDDWTGTKRTSAILVTVSCTYTRPPDRRPICCIAVLLHVEMQDMIKTDLVKLSIVRQKFIGLSHGRPWAFPVHISIWS